MRKRLQERIDRSARRGAGRATTVSIQTTLARWLPMSTRFVSWNRNIKRFNTPRDLTRTVKELSALLDYLFGRASD